MIQRGALAFRPLAAAALLGTMALIQLVRLAVASRGQDADRLVFARSRWSIVAIVLGTLVGFGAAIDTLGFAISTFLVLLVLFGVIARKRWWIALTVALLTIEKAGYGVESATVLIIMAPKGLPQPIAAKLEKAFVDAAKMEPFVSVAKKSETIIGDSLR